jgi:hypothetical protein
MRARESRKEMNVRGAISNYIAIFILNISVACTLDTALSFGASGGRGLRNVDAGERAGDDIVIVIS